MPKKSNSLPPPYMSAGLFRSTVEAFAESTIPSALDRHILSDLSVADYSSLISACVFLAGQWQQQYGPRSVPGIGRGTKKGRVPNTRACCSRSSSLPTRLSCRELISRVAPCRNLRRRSEVLAWTSGQMLIKSVRFYIKTMRECGKSVSQHITKPRRSTQKKVNGGGPKNPIGKKKPPEAPNHAMPPLTEKTPFQVLFELLDPNAMTGRGATGHMDLDPVHQEAGECAMRRDSGPW